LYVNDFDKNKSNDLVLSYYNEEKQYPVRGRQCSADQVPGIKSKYKNYESFANATVSEIYGKALLKEAQHFSIKDFSSIIMKNEGLGTFKKHLLPVGCQVSAINDIVIQDFNYDEHLDVLLAGNLYGSEVETPRSDAGIGQLLLGDGQLNFTELSYQESGLLLNNDVKKMVTIKGDNKNFLISACNNGPIIIHEVNIK